MENFPMCAPAYAEELTKAVNSMGYDDKRKAIAIKAVGLYIQANGIKMMSGRGSAHKFFKKQLDFEVKHDFFDTQEIILRANEDLH